MSNNLNAARPFSQEFQPDFVIGVVLGGSAKAYDYMQVVSERVVNDTLGEHPLFVWAAGEDFRVYSRSIGGRELTFEDRDGEVFDLETGTRWDPKRGLAVLGELSGEVLQPVPSLTSYDWAWRDFYPETEIYGRD
jgi:hypothetical protein